MKILVTGGNGFIGKNIKESYLAQKYTIIAPSRLELDCSDDDSMQEYFKKNSLRKIVKILPRCSGKNLFLSNFT